MGGDLHAEIGQSRVIQRSGKRGVPMKLAIGFLDRQIVDARVAVMHQSGLVELPVLVSVGTIPVAEIIMPFVGEAHRDPAPVESPQFLYQPVVQLPLPFAGKEIDDCRATLGKLRAIAPPAIDGIGQRDLLRIACFSAFQGRIDGLASVRVWIPQHLAAQTDLSTGSHGTTTETRTSPCHPSPREGRHSVEAKPVRKRDQLG